MGTTGRSLPGPRNPIDAAKLIRGLTSDPCPALDEAARRYGPLFSVGAGPMRMVVVGGPDQLTELFAAPTEAFRWGHWLNVLGFVVGDGSMIVSDGADHRRRRAAVQPAFARRHLDAWVPMIVAETDRTIDEAILPAQDVIDLYPIERMLVLRTVLKVLFGAGLDDHLDEISELFEPAKEYLEQSAVRQIPHPFPHTKHARAHAARRRLDELIDREIARRRANPDAESVDVLDTMLAAAGPDALSDSEIRDQVVTLIGAGYDTTTASLSWATLRAAADPDVWSRLRREAEVGLVDDFGPATIGRLPYATAVVRETLRLHPAGVLSPRQAVRDVPVGAFTIPAKSMILWSPHLAGRDPSVWPEPLAFRPERHLDEDPVDRQAHEAGWVPFGRGPRRCIGFGLAQLELTLMLSRLAQRADLTLATAGLPRPYGMVVNRPKGGVPARVRRGTLEV